MTVALIVVEVLCVAAVVAGVAMWSVPAGLIVAGVAGVVVLERVQARYQQREVKQ